MRPLTEARIAVRNYYRGKGLNLEFSFDGNLVGDFGEACAVEEYGMILVKAKSNAGFDGYTPDESGPSKSRLKALPPKVSRSVIQKLKPITYSFLSSISTAASAAPSTTVQSTMCERSCPASRGKARSRFLLQSSDKRRHESATTSVSRWCVQMTSFEVLCDALWSARPLPCRRYRAHE